MKIGRSEVEGGGGHRLYPKLPWQWTKQCPTPQWLSAQARKWPRTSIPMAFITVERIVSNTSMTFATVKRMVSSIPMTFAKVKSMVSNMTCNDLHYSWTKCVQHPRDLRHSQEHSVQHPMTFMTVERIVPNTPVTFTTAKRMVSNIPMTFTTAERNPVQQPYDLHNDQENGVRQPHDLHRRRENYSTFLWRPWEARGWCPTAPMIYSPEARKLSNTSGPGHSYIYRIRQSTYLNSMARQEWVDDCGQVYPRLWEL